MNVLRTLLVLVMLILVPTPEMRAGSVDKINICHIEQRVADELFGTVISIPVQAWPGHERHFDYQAPGLNVGEPCGVIE